MNKKLSSHGFFPEFMQYISKMKTGDFSKESFSENLDFLFEIFETEFDPEPIKQEEFQQKIYQHW